jgi:hypothetical protein
MPDLEEPVTEEPRRRSLRCYLRGPSGCRRRRALLCPALRHRQPDAAPVLLCCSRLSTSLEQPIMRSAARRCPAANSLASRGRSQRPDTCTTSKAAWPRAATPVEAKRSRAGQQEHRAPPLAGTYSLLISNSKFQLV